MTWLQKQWNDWKAKSVWSKLSDVFFTALLITLLIPEGRIFVQRMVLKTGLFGSVEVNTADKLTAQSLNWQLTDLNGNSITLADLEGHVVFINFWGTWCPPCNAEMPGIISLMQQTEPNVKFIFAANESPQTIKKHLTKKGWDIPAYTYNSSPGSELSATSLPTTYILDTNGRIVHHSAGMKQWDTDDAMNLLRELASSPN